MRKSNVVQIQAEPINIWKPLVLKAQAGSRNAIRQLVELSQGRFFKFCLYLTGQQQAACDLYQETIIKAIENISSMNEPYNFQSWLTMIARNIFLDSKKGRKNKDHLNIDDVSNDITMEMTNPGLTIEIRRALDGLEAQDRMVLLLVDMQGYSYYEAARIMKVSESAVRSRLHRARKAFASGFQQTA